MSKKNRLIVLFILLNINMGLISAAEQNLAAVLNILTDGVELLSIAVADETPAILANKRERLLSIYSASKRLTEEGAACGHLLAIKAESSTGVASVLRSLHADYRAKSVCSSCLAKTKKLFKCGKCKEVYYCGEKCQADDWRQNHRTECDLFVKTAASSATGTVPGAPESLD